MVHQQPLQPPFGEDFLRHHVFGHGHDFIPAFGDEAGPKRYAQGLPEKRSDAKPVCKAAYRSGKGQVKQGFCGQTAFLKRRRCQGGGNGNAQYAVGHRFFTHKSSFQ